MRAVNSYSSLIGICFIAFGCAAQAAGEDEVGSVAEAESEARLLALGDSIAFGYNPLGDFTSDKNFKGYPEVLKSDYAIKNPSCPGETSGSLFSPTAPDNGCRAYRAAYPLHVNYGNDPTQLDYALDRLTSNDPGDVPTLITLNVGGNDFFLLQKSCATQPDPTTCYTNGVPGVTGAIAANVSTILSRIRNEGGYQGRLVFMNLYALRYDAATAGGVFQVNQYISGVARAYGAQIADAFSAFGAASAQYNNDPCAAGLLIRLSPTQCDVHPTAAGQALLANSVRNAQ